MRTIKIFQPLNARPARIFQALTDPADLRAWHADVVRGRIETGRSVELEWPRLGARLALEVIDLVAPRKVAFTGPLGKLELSVVAGGLELRHVLPFDDDDLYAGTESSWRLTLATLATYLTRHVGRKRHVHWSLVDTEASAEICHLHFTDARLLPTWFGRSELSIGPRDSFASLTLDSGRRLRGPVLAHTEGRDLALRWGEADDSLLVLRSLPSPDREDARRVALSWSRWTELPEADAIAKELDRALDRLAKRLASVPRS